MKKTLVALAALAATGAFAQVSITGKLGFSYQKNATPAGGSANHGMAMADGDLNFAAMEDLGGGMKAETKIAFAARGRDNSQAARDATIGLTTTFGKFTLGSVESCSAHLNTAGAPVSLATGHDSAGGPIDICGNIDIARFDVPVGPVVLGAAYIDSIHRQLGVGTAAGAGDLTANLLAASYASGPLSVALDHTVYSGNAAAQAALGVHVKDLTRTRLSGSYDLGVAKLGLGFQTNNNSKASQSNFSVNVPMGALQAGLVYSARNGQDAAPGLAAADSRTATAVGLQYNLSKMTNVNASYSTYSNSAVMGNEFRLRLMKSF